jgi:hypothetical protein
MEEQNPFGAGFEESVSGSFVKWTEVGQKVKGVCTEIYERENALKGGEMQTIVVVDTEEGDSVQVALKDQSMKSACKKLMVGQQVGFLFAELIPAKSKGYQDFKLIKVYLGQLDPSYGEKTSDFKVEEQPF